MKQGEDHRDAGLMSPAILLVVLALIVVAFGVLQVGLSADRSGRVQVAADAAALAVAQSLAPGGPSTPSLVPAGAGGSPRDLAVRYAMLNLPGLEPDGVSVTVTGRRATVRLRDRTPLSSSPLTGLRTPDNQAVATAAVITKCYDDGTATAAEPCPSSRTVVRLVSSVEPDGEGAP